MKTIKAFQMQAKKKRKTGCILSHQGAKLLGQKKEEFEVQIWGQSCVNRGVLLGISSSANWLEPGGSIGANSREGVRRA